MPKTRQQRIAEEQAGHAPSPPQVLTDKPRGPRRTRAKPPSANNAAGEGPVVPSQPLAAPGPHTPRALVHVWVNEDRYVYDPNHEFAISSELVPELVLFLNKLRDHGTQHSSSSSATQVTPSLNRRQVAASFQISRTEPEPPEPSAPMEPQLASSGIVSAFKETSPQMETHASFAQIEQPSQQFSVAMAPLSAPPHVRSPPQETYRSITLHDSRPAGIEAPSKQTAYPVRSTRVKEPVNTISQSVTPTHALQQAVSKPSRSEIVNKQTLNQKMPDQKISEDAKLDRRRPTSESGLSLKRKAGASEAASRKKRARSGKESKPPPSNQNLSPVPSDPKMLRACGLPFFFRKYRNLPAYTVDGEVRYGVVEPSDNYLKFHDEVPANPNSNITKQASSSSAHGRVIRPTRSIKRRFGFSPLTTISERAEITPPMKPAKSQPAMRVPSRLFDRMNANKRKRWTSPESIPNPKGKSNGLGEVEFYGNAKEDEDQIAGQQPGKVRRTSNSHNFSSQGAANSVSSRQYTCRKSIISKPAITVTNKAGSFKVPSPGDSDWSNSESEDEGSSQAATAPTSPIANRAPPAAAAMAIEVNSTGAGQTFEAALSSSPAPTSRPRFTAFEAWLQTASPSVASALEQMDVDPNVAGAAFQRGLVNNTTT